jgi:transposase
VRRIVEPPPSSLCDRCGGQLKLKRIDTANSVLGLNRQIFACAKCGNERLFVAQRDLYASQAAAEQRLMRV